MCMHRIGGYGAIEDDRTVRFYAMEALHTGAAGRVAVLDIRLVQWPPTLGAMASNPRAMACHGCLFCLKVRCLFLASCGDNGGWSFHRSRCCGFGTLLIAARTPPGTPSWLQRKELGLPASDTLSSDLQPVVLFQPFAGSHRLHRFLD